MTGAKEQFGSTPDVYIAGAGVFEPVSAAYDPGCCWRGLGIDVKGRNGRTSGTTLKTRPNTPATSRQTSTWITLSN